MKRFLFFLIATILFAVTSANAQSARTLTLAAGDTVTNTGTASKVLPLITGGYVGAAVEAKYTKISGTVGGTIGLYGSFDGTNYEQIGSNYTATNVATQVHHFYVTGPLPPYLKVLGTGTGTMSAVLTVKYRLPIYQQ